VSAVAPTTVAAATMGAAIVSVALKLDGLATPSEIFLWLAIAGLAGLAAASARRAAAVRSGRWVREAPAAPTLIAAPCVVSSRLAIGGAEVAAGALLLAIAAAWVAVLPAAGTRRASSGSTFLLAVAAFATSATLSTLAIRWPAAALAGVALVPLAAGLGLYGTALRRFDPAELVRGRGDHWIAGGGAAIGTLALALAARGSDRLSVLAPIAPPLRVIAWGAWAMAILWLLALVFAEARWRRPWLDLRRWASVFPLGMYATACFVLGRVESARPLTLFASVWIWVAVCAWLAAATASASQLGARTRAAPAATRRAPTRAPRSR